MDNESKNWKTIFLNTRAQTYIASGYFDRRKFILDSKENWSLEVLSPIGAVEIYVGLDPKTVGPQNHIWSASSKNGVAQLQVKTSDLNFHLSAYYYVYIESISGIDAIVSITLRQQKNVHYLPNYESERIIQDYSDNLLFSKF